MSVICCINDDAFPIKASVHYDQIHTYDKLNFDDKQMSIKGYPYRFGVANKIDGKTFFRCMECRNLKNRQNDRNLIVGTLVFHTKENLLKGDANAPGCHQHLCNDSALCPLPSRTANIDFIESLKLRSIIDPTFYSFDRHVLRIANQPITFKKIGCTEGARHYDCASCVAHNKKYRPDTNNFLIFNIHQKCLYSNVNGLSNFKHICNENVQRQQIVQDDDVSSNSFEMETASEFGGDDFDTVSVSDSASNIGIKRPHSSHQDSSNDNNYFNDVDSIVVMNDSNASALRQPSDDGIQPAKQQRRSFSSYFNFSFIPSRSTVGFTVPKIPPQQSSAENNNDQQEMDSDGKVLMASTILRRVYVEQTSGEKHLFPHADIMLPIEHFSDAEPCLDMRNNLRNCPKPRVVIFADSLLTLLDPTSLNPNVLLIRIEKMAYIGTALNAFLNSMDKDFVSQECLFVIVAGYDMVRCFPKLPLLSTASQLHKDVLEFAKKISPSKVIFVTTPEIGILKSALQLLNLGMLQALTLQNNGNIHVYNFAEEVAKSSFANTSVLTRTLFLLKGIEENYGCSLLSSPNTP